MLLIGYRLAVWERAKLAQPAFQSANALMSLSFVAAALLTLSRMAARLADLPSRLPPLDWSLVILLGEPGSAELAGGVDRPAPRLAAVVHGYRHHRGRADVPRHPRAQPFEPVGGTGDLRRGGGHRGCWLPATSAGIASKRARRTWSPSAWARAPCWWPCPWRLPCSMHRSVPEFSALNELGMLAAGVLLLATRLHVPDPLHDARRGRVAGDLPRDPGAVHQHDASTCRPRPSG